MINAKELKELLKQFNKNGYLNSDTIYLDNGKNGKILKLQIDNFTYEDEFYGGEPYCGNETIWENGIDVFRSVYWGDYAKGVNVGNILRFLNIALSKGSDNELVHRGPHEYTEGNLRYTNTIDGNIEDFRQVEKIFENDKEVYIGYFTGGRVNIQKE